MQPNFADKTIWTGDNPDILRGMNSECVDLIYLDAPISYPQNKHVLFGQQEGLCAGCRTMFPFRNFTVDHLVPQSRGGTDHLGNLQLLCGACNSLKGARPQEYLMARLKETVA